MSKVGKEPVESDRDAMVGDEPVSIPYLTDVLTRIVNDHPNSRIDELLPWAYATPTPVAAVA